jgi:hypothetical protein
MRHHLLKDGLRRYYLLALSLLLSAFPGVSQAIEWPQEVTAAEGSIFVYQPQPEKLEGNVLSGRAAMSLELKGQSDPIFGTFWFRSRIDTDQDAGIAIVRDIEVVNVRWPDSKDADEQRFSVIVEGAMPKAGFEISLERLSASLATAEIEQKSLDDLKNDPPVIVFREQLAVLLLYDGEPVYEKIDNSNYERAVNTPFVVVREGKSRYFLSSGQLWYQSGDARGPWQSTSSPPADLAAMMPKPDADTPPAPKVPPEIVVATEPTELISTDGKPNWESLTGGELLYVSNTESPWLRDLPTGNMYVLLSGRWYRSKSTSGPWTFVRADELPASFANIPPASDIGGLRTSVAGTPEAEEAVLDAQIPQTAAISRSSTTLEVQYDGKPKFEQVTGTRVSYAVNTATQVLLIDNRYYAADNGVWFMSSSANGPWTVADSVPEEEIAKIPPSSPVYNTTHMHIYQSTPQVVYVGYTPGYMWSYPYYGVPVYGTGWRYPPYRGPYYYPRPPTWGFNVGYNPWTGWNFGMSWSNGFLSVGVSFGGGYNNRYRGGCCGNGWYGGGYRGPTIINTGDINIGNSINVGDRNRVVNNIENNKTFNRNNLEKNNIYNRPGNSGRNADKALVKRDMQKARSSAGKANNVYADRDGNVARLENGNWQSRENGAWKDDPRLNQPVTAEQRERAAQARDQATPEQRERVAQARDQATPEQRDKAASALNSRDVSASRPQTRPATQPAAKPVARPTTAPAAKPASRPSSSSRQTDLNKASRARQSGAARERRAPPSRSRARR